MQTQQIQHEADQLKQLKQLIMLNIKLANEPTMDFAPTLFERQDKIKERLERMGILRDKLSNLIGEKDAVLYMITAMRDSALSHTIY